MLSLAGTYLLAAVFCQEGTPPSAAQILDRCQKAYDAVRTFEQDVKGSIDRSSGTAHICFQRPGRLSVRGDTLFGSPYALISDGKVGWVLSAGEWRQESNVEMGIAAITGISSNAGTLVPSILFHARWAGLPDPKAGKLSVASVKLDGKPAYRIGATAPYPMRFWLDPKSSFVLRTEMDVMGKTITVVFGPPKVNQPIPASVFSR